MASTKASLQRALARTPASTFLRPRTVRLASTCSTAAPGQAASLPPILWTYLPSRVPYEVGLALQEALVRYKIDAKNASDFASSSSASTSATPDVLLLLQHRPVYTSGRREKDAEVLDAERKRLAEAAPGADYVMTMRGGQTTYHGPGQLTGYPILDLGPMNMSTRIYVDRLLAFLASVLLHPSLPLQIPTLSACTPDLPVGTFITPTTKIGSIGVQVRRRVTSHGFALNVESQVESWFKKIVACGLSDVQMVSIQGVTKDKLDAAGAVPAEGTNSSFTVDDVIPAAVETFGKVFGRRMEPLGGQPGHDEQVLELVELANRQELASLATKASS